MSRSVRKKQAVEEEMDLSEEEMDQEVEMEEAQFDEIEKLEQMGITATDIAKLKSGGVLTVAAVKMHTVKDLCNIKGLSEAKVEKIMAAADKLDDSSFITATESLQMRANITRITTGSKELDTLLGGGVETQSITEVFGEFRTGKTQLCHTLCVTSQLPRSMQGGNGKVVYIDTEGTFRPENIEEIAKRFGMDPKDTLDNIIVGRAFTHEHQLRMIHQAAAKMVEDQYRTLIIDSITALYRVDFSGRGELAERQQKLAKMLSCLIKMSCEFNIAIFITNQVVSDPGAMFTAASAKPIGGNILAHASTTRLALRKGKGDQRICKIYDSPSLPESDAVFSISTSGITDSTD